MAVVYDVPATAFISKTAQKLKETGKVTPPAWAADVKTGVHKQLPPAQPDWFYTRSASVLRRIYTDGPVGVQRLRSLYGGRKNRGVKPDRHARGGGAIIRNSLQQLEKAGFVKAVKDGRVITAAGMSFLDKIATEMVNEKSQQKPEA